MKCNTSRPFCI